MLIGERVQLRPIREADLPAFVSAHLDIGNRGAYFPLGVLSEPVLRRRFGENGLWDRSEGTLLIWHEDELVGHIEFFTPVSYWDAFELSYQLYGDRHSGHGYTTEAVSAPGRLPDRDEEAASDPPRHRSRQPGELPRRREVRVRARGNCAGRVLQWRAQPRRAPLLPAPNRSAALARLAPPA